MYLYQSAQFKSAKGETTGAALQRIRNALRAAGYVDPSVGFYFEDMIDAKVSSSQRVAKKFPELATFAGVFREEAYIDEIKMVQAIHNLDDRWKVGFARKRCEDVPWEVLLEVAHGIPKAYPFMYSNFVIELPDWLSEQGLVEERDGSHIHSVSPGPHPRGCEFPCIVLSSQWWTTRRQITVSSSSPFLAPPDSAKKMPALHPRIQAVLDGLGTAQRKSLQAVQTVKEKAATRLLDERAEQIMSRYRQSRVHMLPEVYDRFGFPHDLPSTREMGKFSGEWGAGATRPALDAVFRPRGFRSLCKKSARNNLIKLVVDPGTWFRAASFFFSIQGLNWREGFFLAVSPRAIDDTQYPILDQDQWRRVCENIGAVVDYVEQHAFAEVEQVYPPTPLWYEFSPK